MPLSTIPEKTEESLGIVKTDALPYTDPETQVPAEQYERLKDAVIANALAIGLGDGSTADSLEARIAAVARPTIDTVATNTATLANSDNGRLKRCTSANGCTVTIPAGRTPGTTVEYVQEHVTGQVEIVGDGVTIRLPSAFVAKTKEKYSSIVVTILDADEALVRGDLEEA